MGLGEKAEDVSASSNIQVCVLLGHTKLFISFWYLPCKSGRAGGWLSGLYDFQSKANETPYDRYQELFIPHQAGGLTETDPLPLLS